MDVHKQPQDKQKERKYKGMLLKSCWDRPVPSHCHQGIYHRYQIFAKEFGCVHSSITATPQDSWTDSWIQVATTDRIRAENRYHTLQHPIGDCALSGNLWRTHTSIHRYPQPPWYAQSLARTPSNSLSSTDLSHCLPTTWAGQATSDEIQRIGTKDKQERGETELPSFHIHTEVH